MAKTLEVRNVRNTYYEIDGEKRTAAAKKEWERIQAERSTRSAEKRSFPDKFEERYAKFSQAKRSMMQIDGLSAQEWGTVISDQLLTPGGTGEILAKCHILPSIAPNANAIAPVAEDEIKAETLEFGVKPKLSEPNLAQYTFKRYRVAGSFKSSGEFMDDWNAAMNMGSMLQSMTSEALDNEMEKILIAGQEKEEGKKPEIGGLIKQIKAIQEGVGEDAKDFREMLGKLPKVYRKNATWIIDEELETKLQEMPVGEKVNEPLLTYAEDGTPMILGKPAIFTAHFKDTGSKAILADLSRVFIQPRTGGEYKLLTQNEVDTSKQEMNILHDIITHHFKTYFDFKLVLPRAAVLLKG